MIDSYTNNEGVSPVIGVILMVAVAVILASVIAVFVLDIGGTATQSNPVAATDFDEDRNVLTLTSTTNTDRVEIRVDDTVVGEISEPGETYEITRSGDVSVVAVSPNGEESVVQTFTDVSGTSSFSSPSSSAPTCSNITYEESGTISDPYLISNDKELQCMSKDLDGVYKLSQNIDLGGTDQWNSGNGFKPVGTNSNRFTGEFIGNNKEIKGISILRASDSAVGIFGYTEDFTAKSFTVSNANVKGGFNSGIFAGYVENVGVSGNNLKNITVKNSVMNSNFSSTGAVFGQTSVVSNIENITVENSDVDSLGRGGGVIGIDNGSIINNITVTGTSVNVGNTFGEGGGVVGKIGSGDSELTNVTVQGATIKSNSTGVQNLGGAVGLSNAGLIEDVEVVNTTIESPGSVLGGLIGFHGQRGFDSDYDGVIRNSNTRNLTVDGEYWVSGGIGQLDYSGATPTEVRNIHSTNSTIRGTDSAGGLFGYVYVADVKNVYSNNEIIGEDKNGTYQYIGGITSSLENGTIDQAYSLSSITADSSASNQIYGGLIGRNYGTIKNSYAETDVQSNSYGGGAVGINCQDGCTSDFEGTIKNVYAVGEVSGSGDLGGLVGRNYGGPISDSYWDTQATGQSNAVGVNNGTTSNLVGLTTSEMQGSSASSNMSALDFSSIWTTVSGDYPELQNNRES